MAKYSLVGAVLDVQEYFRFKSLLRKLGHVANFNLGGFECFQATFQRINRKDVITRSPPEVDHDVGRVCQHESFCDVKRHVIRAEGEKQFFLRHFQRCGYNFSLGNEGVVMMTVDGVRNRLFEVLDNGRLEDHVKLCCFTRRNHLTQRSTLLEFVVSDININNDVGLQVVGYCESLLPSCIQKQFAKVYNLWATVNELQVLMT
mmetsp:Transcript_18627/g.36435  ORF Transcript_18627/g.36435 Transcript_18627/m.36435 type:complete len:203 (-) Transcript_18627:2224-2832(-)